MTDREPIPQFETLAVFAGDLRDRVFRYKTEAARYFGLDHTTIGRYEDGKVTPPLPYLLRLTQLVAARLELTPSTHPLETQQLLREINKAIDLCYPGFARLHTWDDLLVGAQGHLTPAHSQNLSSPRCDWELAPATPNLVGRDEMLHRIAHAIEQNEARLIGLSGMGGIGKSWLAAAVAHGVAFRFTHVIWRSLRNAPPISEILPQLIRFITDQQIGELPIRLDEQLALLLHLLRERRVLLVLDNLESTLLAEGAANQYRPGYEGYGELLCMVRDSAHQSCLLVTSRELPPELALPPAVRPALQVFRLLGLATPAVQSWLAGANLQGSAHEWERFVAHYSGNPLALQFAAQTVLEQHGGQLAHFLQERITIFGEIRTLLDEQFHRLTSLEQAMLYWLAILREPATRHQLAALMVTPLVRQQLVDLLRSLLRRCWVETDNARFGLQNVVLEYLTDRLVGVMSDAILQRDLARLQTHGLLVTDSPNYLHQVQQRLLLQPVAEQIRMVLGRTGALRQLARLKTQLRRAPAQDGYAGANLLHLCAYLCAGDLHGQNFARLTFRKAIFRGLELRAANFTQARFDQCEFVDSFGIVSAVAFSPDGAWLAVGASNDTLCLWRLDLAEGSAARPSSPRLHEPIECEPALPGADHQTWIERRRRIRVLAFDQRSQLLAAGYENGAVGVWAAPHGRLIAVLYRHSRQVCALAFTAQGDQLLSASVDQTICSWAVGDWSCLDGWQGDPQRAKAIAFHPFAPLLASAVQNSIHLWDTRLHRHQQHLSDEQATEILCLAFSPDGRWVVSGDYHGAINLWDVQSGRRLWRATAHLHEVRSIVFAPTGDLLASASHDGMLRIWDAYSGACVQTIDARENALFAADFHPAGALLASAAQDGAVRLWGVTRPQHPSIHAGECLTLRQGWSSRLWELALGEEQSSMQPGFLLSGGDDGRIQCWDWPAGALRHILIGHTRAVRALACQPGNQSQSPLIASASIDATVRLWSVTARRCRRVLVGHAGGLLALAFRPDGQLLASGGYDHRVRIWDVETGDALFVLSACRDTVRALAFSPDGLYLAAASSDYAIHLWDAQTFTYLASLVGHAQAVMSLSFDHTAQLLASADGAQVRLWNIQTGDCQVTFEGCYPLIFHPTQPLLFALRWDRSTPQVVDVQSGHIVHQFGGATGHLHCLKVSASGRFLFGAGEEGLIRVWESAGGALVNTLAPARIYEGMNLQRTSGLTVRQMASLRRLGAMG
jgi:WD40 repeat protein